LINSSNDSWRDSAGKPVMGEQLLREQAIEVSGTCVITMRLLLNT